MSVLSWGAGTRIIYTSRTAECVSDGRKGVESPREEVASEPECLGEC